MFVLARAGPGPLRADSADPEPADVEPARGYLWEIARSEIVGGTVVHYRPETGRIAGWAALGSLLTATHGWYLLITFPTWVITGTAAASAESYRPLEELGVGTGEGWTAVRRYARFPQGLPDTVDRAQLSPVIEPRR